MTEHEDIPSAIHHWSETCPDKEVFVFFDKHGNRTHVLTARQVYVASRRFACFLKRRGFSPGQLISNALANSVERIITDFGIIMAGCIASNCQVMEKDGSDLWRTSRTCHTDAIIIPKRESNPTYSVLQHHLPSVTPKTPCVAVPVTIPAAPSIGQVILIDRIGENSKGKDVTFLEMFLQVGGEDGIEEIQLDHTDPSSIAYVFATSGTTGFSKMSPRTHKALMGTAGVYAKGVIHPVRFNSRPLGWLGGFSFPYLGSASPIVMQDCFEGKVEVPASVVWDVIEREKCTTAFMLPTEIETFMKTFRTNPPRYKFQTIIVGGQPLTKKVGECIGVLTNCLICGYASTETSGVTNITLTSPDQMIDFMVGRPFPGVKIKILDDNLEDMPVGQKGTVAIKTPNGCDYYFDRSSSSSSSSTTRKTVTTSDGYFITGDRGWLTVDGNLYVSDRIDDVIEHGSILVYPSWPESLLTKIPEVAEAVVLGVPNQNNDGGSLLCACVVLRHGCEMDRESLLSAYNNLFVAAKDEFFPKFFFVEFFENFPKSRQEKLDRRKLRQQVYHQLGIEL